VQARERVEEARKAEHAARRAWDASRSNPTLDFELRAAQKEHRRAQDWLAQVERSAAAVPRALEEARKTLLMEESAYATMLAAHRRTETQQAQRVRQAEAQVEQIQADWCAILGGDDAH
jgi:hypothetical protein